MAKQINGIAENEAFRTNQLSENITQSNAHTAPGTQCHTM